MKDLAKKKDSDLLDMLAEKKKALQDMQFSLSKSKPGEQSMGNVKKDIARIMTELSSRRNK